MARFAFEATFKTIDSAAFIHTEPTGYGRNSGLERNERAGLYTVSGFCEDYEMETLGLRVMNLDDLVEFKVNRVLAEYSAADARRWMKGA